MIELPREACLAASARAAGTAPTFDRFPLQTGLGGCPWRVAVASVMLNRTRGPQARPVLRRFLARWPDAAAAADADVLDVADVLAPSGFQYRKARSVVALSRRWVLGGWSDARDLPGVGAYVADAVGMFCFGCLELDSQDRVLRRYADEVVRKRSTCDPSVEGDVQP